MIGGHYSFYREIKMFVLFMILQVSQHASAMELYEGEEFVLLPCEFYTYDLENPTVVWSRYDLSPSTVHQRQQEGDELKDQNQLYRGRTSMTTDALETGDLDLNLTKLLHSDSGTYTCTVRVLGRERRLRDVHLQVKERFPSWAKALLILLVVLCVVGGLLVHFREYFMSVYKVEVYSGVESVQLPCKTIVCLFKDVKVEWRRSEFRVVHVYLNGSDQSDQQDQFYRCRTKMKRNLQKTGDLSLTLKHPTYKDRGKYTCTVYGREEEILISKIVHLLVKEKTEAPLVPDGPDLRIVIIGKTGVGKSAVGNTILGEKKFNSRPSVLLVTETCEEAEAHLGNRKVSVIDTPGIIDTKKSAEFIKEEIVRCVEVSCPGPHVFLLVIQVGRFTKEEKNSVEALQALFGPEANQFMIVLFTRGGDLGHMTIQQYVREGNPDLQRVIQSCKSIFHVFENNNGDRTQVVELIKKIDDMVSVNGGTYYTDDMYRKVQESQQMPVCAENTMKD